MDLLEGLFGYMFSDDLFRVLLQLWFYHWYTLGIIEMDTWRSFGGAGAGGNYIYQSTVFQSHLKMLADVSAIVFHIAEKLFHKSSDIVHCRS